MVDVEMTDVSYCTGVNTGRDMYADLVHPA